MARREANRAIRYFTVLCPLSGALAALVATLVAAPLLRRMAAKLADEVGVEAPASVRLFTDHNLLLAAAAVALGAAAVFIVPAHPNRAFRVSGSMIVTLLLFVPVVVLVIGFWSLYLAAIESAAGG